MILLRWSYIHLVDLGLHIFIHFCLKVTILPALPQRAYDVLSLLLQVHDPVRKYNSRVYDELWMFVSMKNLLGKSSQIELIYNGNSLGIDVIDLS